MFIAIYGINNIGKTTHTELLVERLKKEEHDAVRVKYPVYDLHPTGEYLNEVLRLGKGKGMKEEELQMWFTLNRHQYQDHIQSWLDQGKFVVAEDYTGTGIAWGTAKGVETTWLEELNKHLLREDLAILMDGERAKGAIEKGHIHEENHDLVERCRQVHLELGKKYGWQKVELQPRKEETAALIWGEIEKHLN